MAGRAKLILALEAALIILLREFLERAATGTGTGTSK